MVSKVQKRDGTLVDFNIKKIESAVEKAFKELHKNTDPTVIGLIAMRAVYRFDVLKSFANGYVTVEEIQDCVEKVLADSGYSDVAKAYILYREQHKKLREAHKSLLDYEKVVDDYLNASDWRVKENATAQYSLGGLIMSNSGAVTANYWLSEIYPKEIADAHRNTEIHIHDLSMLSGYCFTGDTKVYSLDGKNKTFKELVDNNIKELWVYAYDKSNNEIIPAKAINPRVTRYVTELIKVNLTNSVSIQCTPGHLFMTRTGDYIEAQNLKANMSLMPLYINSKGKYTEIHRAWHNKKNTQMYVHRWVAEKTFKKPLEANEVVHHINGDKHDNRPENLKILNDKDHRRMELANTQKTDTWITANKKRLIEYNKSEQKIKEIKSVACTRARYNKGRFIQFKYVKEKDLNGNNYNHCVRSIEKITLKEAIPVYDLTVPNYENFAISGGVFVHNCAGWNLKQLIQEGLGGVEGKIASAPASHLSTLCNQMVNFIGCLANEWSGAQAFSSFDTYLAPFVRVDNLSYKEVKQAIQCFIYGVNTPSRWSTQPPFSNITLDWTCPNDLKDLPAIVGGKEQDFTYGDCQKEMDIINKAFLELMIEGDYNGRGFQYPMDRLVA